MKQLASLGLMIACAACAPPRPGPYDGKWIGQQYVGGSCSTVTAVFRVKDNNLWGSVNSMMETNVIDNVWVGASGKTPFNTDNRPARWGVISFSTTGFAMNFRSVCGDITISGSRIN